MTIEVEAVRVFEHTGWEAIPEQYHHAFGRLTSQTIGSLLDAVRVKSGTKFLDIATGPGYVAAAAAKRGATVLGIDFSARMIEQARQLHPGIDFREGDAERLPLGNGLFDSAVSNFGILHFAQPELALREAGRVIRAGGYFAFTAWARPEDAIGFDIVLRAVEAYGEPRIELPEGPSFFRFSNPAECVSQLIGAGFDNPTAKFLRYGACQTKRVFLTLCETAQFGRPDCSRVKNRWCCRRFVQRSPPRRSSTESEML
jgi:ubiquinone/menaquinone biosynthesis C-methylase UbiE